MGPRRPNPKPTRLAWKWASHQLAGAPKKHVEGKFEFIVSGASVTGAVDPDARAFALEVRVEYAARTALVSGEAVAARGHCVVALSGGAGASDIAREVTEPGVCVLAEQPPPETPTAVVEGMMRKTDMAAKLWLKKGVPACVWAPLDGLAEKVASLLPEKAP